MEEKEIAYNTLLKRLQNTLPIQKEPEKLTQSILERIKAVNDRNQKNRKMQVISALSGVAAGLLLCLLVHDTMQLPDFTGKQTIRQEMAIQSTIRNSSLENNTIEELIKEKATAIHRKERLLLLCQKQ